jgi:hypothetical protein
LQGPGEQYKGSIHLSSSHFKTDTNGQSNWTEMKSCDVPSEELPGGLVDSAQFQANCKK